MRIFCLKLHIQTHAVPNLCTLRTWVLDPVPGIIYLAPTTWIYFSKQYRHVTEEKQGVSPIYATVNFNYCRIQQSTRIDLRFLWIIVLIYFVRKSANSSPCSIMIEFSLLQENILLVSEDRKI